MIDLLAAHDPLQHVVQQPLLEVPLGSWKVTLLSNQIVMQLIAAGLLLWLIPRAVAKKAGGDEVGRHVPHGFLANAVEWVCIALRENVAKPALGRYTDQFVPYLWTVFFFILACNWLGMVPLEGLNVYVFGHRPILGGTATGNVWVTGTLACCTLFMIVYHGLRVGGMSFITHFFSVGPFPFNYILFGPLEIIGLLARIFALTIRLFANMLAGHILLAVLIGFLLTMSEVVALSGVLGKTGGLLVMIVIVAGCLFVSLLEFVLVGPLQALIFTLLTAVFIGQVVNVQHHHAEVGEPAHDPAHSQAEPGTVPALAPA
jgi:F-type H+-transporting ATPase subunit a